MNNKKEIDESSESENTFKGESFFREDFKEAAHNIKIKEYLFSKKPITEIAK